MIDFGCGAGRALMFFATLPVKKVIGVEVSPVLAEIARRHLLQLSSRRAIAPWEVVKVDARRFVIPDEADLFYFFNPFDAEVMGTVIDRVLESVKRAPRRCTIVYANPVHANESPGEQQLVRLSSPSADFAFFSPG